MGLYKFNAKLGTPLARHIFRFVILGFLDLVSLSTWGGTSLCFLWKVVKQLKQASSQIWCAVEHATSLLLYFPRSARSLSALIAPFVPGHYCVLVIFFGLSVFSFAYVFFLAGSS